jgi:hypothetical protein
MKNSKVLLFTGSLLVSSSLFAGTMGPSRFKTGLYLGLGGGYYSVKNEQALTGIGTGSSIFTESRGVSSVQFTTRGSGPDFSLTQTTCAPAAQIGYLKYISDSSQYLWGVKFTYKYLGITATNDDPITENNSTLFRYPNRYATPEVLNYTIDASYTKINHELNWIAYFGGHAFKNSIFYLGAGLAGFETQLHIDNVIPFNHKYSRVVSIGSSASIGNNWLWGATVQTGLTYYLESDSTWFIDLNYQYSFSGTYAVTTNHSASTKVPFNSSDVNITGTGQVLSKQRVTVQGLTLTANKLFDI